MTTLAAVPPSLAHLGAVDLVVLLLVLAAAGSRLLHRQGLLAALASAAGTAVVLWFSGAAVLVWGPAGVADLVRGSSALTLVPPPTHALVQVADWLGGLVGSASGPGPRP